MTLRSSDVAVCCSNDSVSSRVRLSRFKGCLKNLQDCLGALNDISVHQKLASKLATKPSHRARAFAAGIATGNEQSEIKPLLAAADEHAAKFAHIRPYWT